MIREQALKAAQTRRALEVEREAEAEREAEKARAAVRELAHSNLKVWLNRVFGLEYDAITGVEYSDGERGEYGQTPFATARYVVEGLEFFASDSEPDAVTVRALGTGVLHTAFNAADVGEYLEETSK